MHLAVKVFVTVCLLVWPVIRGGCLLQDLRSLGVVGAIYGMGSDGWILGLWLVGCMVAASLVWGCL